jgi:hypothetical protein
MWPKRRNNRYHYNQQPQLPPRRLQRRLVQPDPAVPRDEWLDRPDLLKWKSLKEKPQTPLRYSWNDPRNPFGFTNPFSPNNPNGFTNPFSPNNPNGINNPASPNNPLGINNPASPNYWMKRPR